MGMGCSSKKYNMRQKQYFDYDRYQIIRQLGKGGQANIYLVYDRYISRQKKVLKEILTSPLQLKKQFSQYKYLTQLNHPNIIKATDCFQVNKNRNMYICIIMEFIEGGQLKQQLNKLSQYQIIIIYCQLKSALQYIHSKNIIHRDITLRNILLDDKKNVKLIDFGISTELYEDTKIITNQNKGTTFYDSPQFIKQSIVRRQTDLWQMGIVMIQLVTGIEIKELMKSEDDQIVNNPAFNPEFPQKYLMKYRVNETMSQLIELLLKKDYRQRKFQQIDNIEQKINQTKIYHPRIKNERKLDEINVRIKTEISKKPQIVLKAINHANDIGHHQQLINQNRYRRLNLSLKGINNTQFSQTIFVYHILNLVQLNCSNNFLTDSCAKIIRRLTHLQELDISGNNLSDNFCKEMNQMFSQFRKLNLAFTNITSESLFIITKYGRIIESLDISYTKVSSIGIISLILLNKLKSLAIWSGNNYYPLRYYNHINNYLGINCDKYQQHNINITQLCLKQISKLRLKQLIINLKQNSADQIISQMEQDATCIEVFGKLSKLNLQKIMNLKKIQILYLKGLQGYEIKKLKSKKLKNIGIVNSQIMIQQILKYLECEQLKFLSLGNNQIGNQGAITIAKKLTNLTTLDLGNNKIGDQGAIAIGNNLINLINLDLSLNNIGQKGAIKIGNELIHLKRLDLGNNKIGDQGAIAIGNNLINLINLNLSWNNIGDQGAITIAKKLTNLTTLDLGNNKIGDQGAIAIGNNLINLINLDLSLNNIGQKGAIKIGNELIHLKRLDLGNNKIGDQGAIAIGNNLINLINLNLSWNNIGDQGAIIIAKKLTNLTTLDLGNNKIGDQGAIAIGNNLINLINLDLWNNKIGDQGAIVISANLYKLKTLNLALNNIRQKVFEVLALNLVNLKHIYLSQNQIYNSVKPNS